MSTLFDLSGKRALVTGGGSGIGLAIATSLADFGADVCVWGRSAERLATATAKGSGRRGKITAMVVDVSHEPAVQAGISELTDTSGAPHIVVVNAGINGIAAPFAASRTADYRALMATNMDGAYWTMREASQAMIEAGDGGSIIAISSLAATEGATHNQAYAATKAGLLAMANGAAVELARHRIRVNTILPGWIATDMTVDAQGSEQFTSKVISRVPMRRWGTPEDFVGAAVYLASDASTFQTGSTVVIDGGYSIF